MSDSDTFAAVTQSQTYYRTLPVSKNKAREENHTKSNKLIDAIPK
jgi:hypothetical protein